VEKKIKERKKIELVKTIILEKEKIKLRRKVGKHRSRKKTVWKKNKRVKKGITRKRN